MYQAINNYVIVKGTSEDDVSESGIIYSTGPKMRHQVVATTKETEKLMDKFIIFRDSIPLEKGHDSVHVDDIVAVEDK